jgi:hypothetical protein
MVSTVNNKQVSIASFYPLGFTEGCNEVKIIFLVFCMTCLLDYGSELVVVASQLNPRLQGWQVCFCLCANHHI